VFFKVDLNPSKGLIDNEASVICKRRGPAKFAVNPDVLGFSDFDLREIVTVQVVAEVQSVLEVRVSPSEDTRLSTVSEMSKIGNPVVHEYVVVSGFRISFPASYVLA
jgi:hypothetical protein